MDGDTDIHIVPLREPVVGRLTVTLVYETGTDDRSPASGYYTVTDSNSVMVRDGDFHTDGRGAFRFSDWGNRQPDPTPAT